MRGLVVALAFTSPAADAPIVIYTEGVVAANKVLSQPDIK